MKKLLYHTPSGASEIFINSEWTGVIKMINPAETVIITDTNISKHYSNQFPGCPVITLKPGEKEKTLSTVESIIQKLLELEVDRSYFLLGIGGGVVCDITGFVAAVYMRGIKFGFVSTSLLSQIDASTGGKNGVNIGHFKNIAGSFTQPKFVICDPQLLKTLPEEEYLSGLGELVKYALIKDRQLFDTIENNIDLILKRDVDLMTSIIETSIKIKIDVVEKDERETGERRLLNFGHTLGHAIELSTGLKHGLAISCGMLIASKMSVEEGILTEDEYQRIVNLLSKLGLINDCPQLNESILEMLKLDKKREKEFIHFILLNGIGNGVIKPIALHDLMKQLSKSN